MKIILQAISLNYRFYHPPCPGGCMGEAFSGRTPGKKAMLWGAMAQSIPDIDFIASSWMDTGQKQEELIRNYSAGLKTFQITCKSHIR